MSVEATAAMWARRDLTSTEKLVAVRLADHAGPDGGHAFPSVRRLMDDTGLSERTVQGALRSLVGKGAVVWEGAHPKYRTNQYRIILTPQEMHPAGDAPPQETAPDPAAGAPTPPQMTADEGAAAAPESSVTVMGNRQSIRADVPVEVWPIFARLRRIEAGTKVNHITRYDQATIDGAMEDDALQEQASRWWSTFDLTPKELAEGLVAGKAGVYWERREEAG